MKVAESASPSGGAKKLKQARLSFGPQPSKKPRLEEEAAAAAAEVEPSAKDEKRTEGKTKAAETSKKNEDGKKPIETSKKKSEGTKKSVITSKKKSEGTKKSHITSKKNEGEKKPAPPATDDIIEIDDDSQVANELLGASHCEDSETPPTVEEKKVNPLLSLVDVALKNKLKKKNAKSKKDAAPTDDAQSKPKVRRKKRAVQKSDDKEESVEKDPRNEKVVQFDDEVVDVSDRPDDKEESVEKDPRNKKVVQFDDDVVEVSDKPDDKEESVEKDPRNKKVVQFDDDVVKVSDKADNATKPAEPSKAKSKSKGKPPTNKRRTPKNDSQVAKRVENQANGSTDASKLSEDKVERVSSSKSKGSKTSAKKKPIQSVKQDDADSSKVKVESPSVRKIEKLRLEQPTSTDIAAKSPENLSEDISENKLLLTDKKDSKKTAESKKEMKNIKAFFANAVPKDNCNQATSAKSLKNPKEMDTTKNASTVDISEPMEVDDYPISICEVDLVSEDETKNKADALDSSISASAQDNDSINKSAQNSPATKGTPKQTDSAKKEKLKIDKAERERLRMKKMLEKEEKAKLKQEREEERRLEREEKERIKEEKRVERENKEKMNQLKKEEADKDKQRKKELKEIQKRKMEEEIEEKKRMKELEKEKLENKKKRAAVAFQSFFIPKEKCSKLNDSLNQSFDENAHNFLSNFTVKSDMRLAPLTRKTLEHENKNCLDELIKTQSEDVLSLYLSQLKSGLRKPLFSKKTWPLEELKNDLVIIEDDLPPVDDTKSENQVIVTMPVKSSRPKLYSFTENRRPPYWGTWTKKSPRVTGRRPFALDTTHLDYTCDSDEEWEEEEPGESVESVAGSDDDEGDNEYDVDNDFMVPHGYLSDEEVLGEDDNALSPETQKAKLKFLEEEFEDEMKKPTKIKKPRLIGIIWQNREGDRPESCPLAVWEFLSKKKILSATAEIEIESSSNVESDAIEEKSVTKKYKEVTDEMIPDLIKLVHGNTNNRPFLAKEFQMFVSKSSRIEDETAAGKETSFEISKISIARKIKELSMWMPCPEEGPMHGKMCWFIEKSIREKYGSEDVLLPNSWSYCLVPKRRSELKVVESAKSANSNENSPFSITKFTKVMTKEEKNKQFVASPLQRSPQSEKPLKPISPFFMAPQPEKKRVSLLCSGPIGKELPISVANGEEAKEPAARESNEKENNSPKLQNVEAESGEASLPRNKAVKTSLLGEFDKSAAKNGMPESDNNDDCVMLID